MRYKNQLLNWYQITRPNKKIFFWQFITSIIPAVLEIIITFFAAEIISSITVFNYESAKNYLLYSIILLSICFIFWNINYFLYPKQLSKIYHHIHNKIFLKILNINNDSLKSNSKEKMIGIISSNINTITEFTNILTKKVSNLLTSIILFISIFYYSLLVGFFTIGICLLTYIIYSIINIYLTNQTNKSQIAHDTLLENFGNIVDVRNISNDLNLSSELKNQYLKSVDEISNNYKKEYTLKLFSDQYLSFLWRILVFAITFYLIYRLETHTINLTIYLLLTPYITSTILNFFDFLSLFNHLSLAAVSALRIKNILDMDEKDIVRYGNNCTENINGTISLTNISYKRIDNNDYNINLNKFNIFIKQNKFIFFEGKKNCGKRTLFYMLKRDIRPTTGTITIDTINIYDFDKKTYSNNLSYTTKSPAHRYPA